MPFPKVVTAVHQIEISSLCSMSCSYCPSPDIVRGKFKERPAVHMSESHFARALEWVRYYVRERKTQRDLNLAGIGESLIHPRFASFVAMARAVVGDAKLILATNGTHVTDEVARLLKEYDVETYVSLHKLDVGHRADRKLRAVGVKGHTTSDPSTNPNTWGKQVDWIDAPYALRRDLPCPWLKAGWLFVMADGRFAQCCLNAKGEQGLRGHVDDPIGSLTTASPWELCRTCYQRIDDPSWDQDAGKPRIF